MQECISRAIKATFIQTAGTTSPSQEQAVASSDQLQLLAAAVCCRWLCQAAWLLPKFSRFDSLAILEPNCINTSMEVMSSRCYEFGAKMLVWYECGAEGNAVQHDYHDRQICHHLCGFLLQIPYVFSRIPSSIG
jgi:hypothetical protein